MQNVSTASSTVVRPGRGVELLRGDRRVVEQAPGARGRAPPTPRPGRCRPTASSPRSDAGVGVEEAGDPLDQVADDVAGDPPLARGGPSQASSGTASTRAVNWSAIRRYRSALSLTSASIVGLLPLGRR